MDDRGDDFKLPCCNSHVTHRYSCYMGKIMPEPEVRVEYAAVSDVEMNEILKVVQLLGCWIVRVRRVRLLLNGLVVYFGYGVVKLRWMSGIGVLCRVRLLRSRRKRISLNGGEYLRC